MKNAKQFTLGEVIAIRRGQTGLTQQRIATEFGYTSPQFISNWERNVAPVPEKHFRKLSQLLGIPVRELVDRRVMDIRRAMLRTVRMS